MLNTTQRAYCAGFLDGDGSIYVQLKPNEGYRFGYQIAAYIVLFQSVKDAANFKKVCRIIDLGYLRYRKDGIMEYIIGRTESIRQFLKETKSFLVMKKKQADLMIKILDKKETLQNRAEFLELAKLVDSFRELNYSKNRKKRTLTP